MEKRPMTEAGAGRRLLMVNIAYWVAAGTYGPFLSAYYTARGMTAAQIGMLLSISPIASILIQPLWARLSDRSGKRKLVLMFITLGAAGTSLLYYCAESFPMYFAVTVIFTAFFSALLPLCDALVIETAGQYHRDFAKIRMGGTLGYAFVVFIIGFYLEKVPMAQFALVCAAILLLVVVESRLPPPRSRTEEQAVGSGGVKTGGKRQIFRSKEAVFVLAFAFVSQMGLGFSGAFMGRYVVMLGYSQSLVGVLSCISALSEVPILLMASRLVWRFGEIPILMASSLLMTVRIFLTGLGYIPTLVVAQLMQSVTYMTVYFCCTTYISKNVLPGKQSQGQSLLAMVQVGFASVIANVGGGFVSDMLGIPRAYMAVALMTLVLTTGVILIYRHSGWGEKR